MALRSPATAQFCAATRAALLGPDLWRRSAEVYGSGLVLQRNGTELKRLAKVTKWEN